jgi:hypothetical protein
MNKIQVWNSNKGLSLPSSIKTPEEVIVYAKNLSLKQQKQIVEAFNIEAYDMAAEYAWKKAMVKLKESIDSLGMKFIGEMIGRPDIDEYTPIESVITDYTAIQLAEQLGIIGSTAALKLRQANELITHYFSRGTKEELEYLDAFGIVKSSIQFILGEQDISYALGFSKFRDRLLNENLNLDDSQVSEIINSPVFYLRTIISILLSSIKNESGAKLEHSLANLNVLIASIWDNLDDSDKWNIGTAYRDAVADGNNIAVKGIKNALLKVNGFDFVPENLRSITFKQTAQQVIETHFAVNNFYNEPAVVRKLSKLGSTIPPPALADCMQAYLAVYLGNLYGISWDASGLALEQLSNISEERWYYYFQKIIHTDEIVLLKFRRRHQIDQFNKLLVQKNLTRFNNLPQKNQQLYNAILDNNLTKAEEIAISLYNKLKGIPAF